MLAIILLAIIDYRELPVHLDQVEKKEKKRKHRIYILSSLKRTMTPFFHTHYYALLTNAVARLDDRVVR